ncbi:heptaprenyl diphosphate synthase [Malonomonas rubra DSM 5091]|uniref:Heptaprenyl diphosphate synthase n=1 Tax=Malonomonas rubra DSM 5091 TaxID=1122189 RepID=A0A1M6JYM3_MALRU|nr:Gx transporter family protein [Malonomonas rubra]SHJ51741.1 heptaprenyl diphosphate synthase [Malonomonas rubra DSM 5091]
MTSSAVDPVALEQTRQRVFMALFIALAVALHTFEALLPNPLPWFRIGLANIMALTALFIYGVQALWIVNMARILVGSLLLGNLFSPAFLLSFSGGLLATLLMGLSFRLFRPKIGPVGVSLCGAVGHIGGQMLIAWLLIVRHPSIWMMLPFFLLFALISGMLNGLVADYLLEALSGHPAFGRLRTMFAKQG